MTTETNTVLTASVLTIIEKLAAFGATPEGGVTRLLYTEPWLAAQRWLEREMAGSGLVPRYDRAGNLYGRLEGSRPESGVVLTGSHVDTVRSGGRYDGAYGIAAAIAAVKQLRDTYGAPRRPIEVASFCEEEGSRFPLAYWGSGIAAGAYALDAADMVKDAKGITLREAMETAGFGRPDQPAGRRSDLHAYVEAHIEQGITLELSARRIGVVETIAGQRRYIATVTGVTNHAGTTPMPLRADALACAAEMVVLLEKAALRAGDPLVATAGRLRPVPNLPNVIAGKVEFTLDIRHTSETMLAGFCDAVLSKFESIAARRGVALQLRPALLTRPAPMDPVLTGDMERICASRGIPYRRMMSGAGHDGQMFAPVCPTAMLFVPSRGGISHSPAEYTAPEELGAGAAVLMEMIYELAYEKPMP